MLLADGSEFAASSSSFAPALPTLPLFIEDRVIREDHAAFGMHSRAPSSADEIMKVSDEDSVFPLVDAGHDEVLDWQIDTLRQG